MLYDFTGRNGDGADGASPYGNLVVSANGALYGTTWEGGGNDYGTVFELRPPAAPGSTWTGTVLYSFTGRKDGANPNSLTMSAKGVLYGSTLDASGGYAGTVFELRPPAVPGGAWTHGVLHAFTGAPTDVIPSTRQSSRKTVPYTARLTARLSSSSTQEYSEMAPCSG